MLGGGFVNTELRELAEPRVFDYFDYNCLDDGERPLLALLEHLKGERPLAGLVRTFVGIQVAEPQPSPSTLPPLAGEGCPVARERESPTNRSVRYIDAGEPDIPFAEVGTPTWDGLPLGRYLSILDLINPMHRLWSDAR